MACFYTSALTAGDFSFCSIAKGVYYDQTAGGAPVLKLSRPYLFNAQVVPVANLVFTAQVTPPIGNVRHLYQQSLASGAPFGFWDRAATQAALDTAYPDGDYTFDIFSSSDGHQFVTNTIVAGSFPNAPTVANLSAAQTVNAASDFTLTWQPFAGGAVADFVSCQLQAVGSNVFTTPAAGTAGALDGTATSVLVPAGTLLPGRAYLGRLSFAYAQAAFTNAQSGGSGATFLFSQTDFWLKTQGLDDNTPPTIAWTTPTNGATAVPSNTPIGVYLTKPMGAGYSISESGAVTGTGGSYASFSPDGLEVVLTPVNGYTLNALHTFIFNPFPQPLAFGDRNGNPLAADTFVLSFTDGATYLTPKRPWLLNPQRQTNGTVEIDLQGQPNYSYTLQFSPDLTTWSPLQTNVAFSGTAHFVITNTAPPGAGVLYRGLAH